MARRVETRGVIESAHRPLENCSQGFDYAIATGRLEQTWTRCARWALQRPAACAAAAIPPRSR